MSVLLYSKGATEEVTGSCHILEINGVMYMVDCGLFQGKKSESDVKNRKFDIAADKVNSVFLTHAHADHCCRLPLMSKLGYKNPIYSTPATRDLALIVMEDSAKIQTKDLIAKDKAKKNNKKKSNKAPLYTDKDAHNANKLFRTFPYEEKIKIDDNVDITFYNAGHILGSSFVSIDIKRKNKDNGFFSKLFGRDKDLNILFTGDLGRPNRPIIKSPATNMPAPDYIVMESTYGNRKHESISDGLEELANVINDTYQKGGKVIIPCFALQRCQEIVLYLRSMMENHKIPRSMPIYLDSPMSISATQVFSLHQEDYNKDMVNDFLNKGKNPFNFGQFYYVNKMGESRQLDSRDEPMIIISASGMMQEGPVVGHLKNLLPDSKNTLIVAGFQAEETLGRKLLEGAKEVDVEGKKVKVEASIHKIESFSSHADYEEATAWLKSIDTSNLKKIFLVHGDKEAQKYLIKHLKENGFKNVEAIKSDSIFKL